MTSFSTTEGQLCRILIETGEGYEIALRFADGSVVTFPLAAGALATVRVGKQAFDIEVRDLGGEPVEPEKRPQLRVIEGGAPIAS